MRTNVYLTFDVEIWCGGWNSLDANFPRSFERYIYGSKYRDCCGLPLVLKLLNESKLRATFFVEPLFSARFGLKYLNIIVDMILNAGHDVELHIHPEWVDEASRPLIENCTTKRQHLSEYTYSEQCELIRISLDLLKNAGASNVTAFRAGSFAVNRDTYRALSFNRIFIDSSLNIEHPDSGKDMRGCYDFVRPSMIEDVFVLPMTVFKDGYGSLRPAQIGAAGYLELTQLLERAKFENISEVVILSHNFEMMVQGRDIPDLVVERRFRRFCHYLELSQESCAVRTVREARAAEIGHPDENNLPEVGRMATTIRTLEQAFRRLLER